MIIGYDAKRIVANGTGLGSYGRTLISALSAISHGHTLRLYAPDRGVERLRSQVALSPSVSFVFHTEKDKEQLSLWDKCCGAFWRSKKIVAQLKKDGVDVFHGLSGELPIGLKSARIPGIVTIHDLIFLRHPEYYNWIDVQMYRWKFLQTLREATRIIAISECTKRDILHYGTFPEDKIDVIYQSCGTYFSHREGENKLQKVHANYNLPTRYILNVGTIEERKNVLLAVKALVHLPKEIHLVVVGRQTPYINKVKQYMEKMQLGNRVHFLHGIPNDELPAIYQMAECFVYPSRYEGFGIPIIEAIQSGLPVIAATGSCLEEAGGPVSLYVSPDDEHATAAAIRQSLCGAAGREERIQRSREYIHRFENQDVAQKVLDCYMRVGQDWKHSLK